MLECAHKPACQKQLAFAHAVLGAWGTGDHLMVADVDEYLALPAQRGRLTPAACAGASMLHQHGGAHMTARARHILHTAAADSTGGA